MSKKILRPFTIAMICYTAMLWFANASIADDETTMTIGSQAPDLDIEHWLSDNDGQFDHTTKLETGRIYVVEFWATWCGPCIAAMPTISKLQDEYADKGVQIISVSDEELDVVEPFLERNVRGKDDLTYQELTNNYCLTTDPDRSVFKDYFRAAGQSGIPRCFIVGKTGLIEWIGHPMNMKEPLQQVIDDEWDREAFHVKYEKERKAIARHRRLQRELMTAVGKAEEEIANGEAEAALAIFDDLLANEDYKSLKRELEALRMQTAVLHVGGEEAVATIERFIEKNETDPAALNQIAWDIYEKHAQDGDVEEEVLAAATRAAEFAIKAAPENGAIYDTLAHLVYEAGDLDRALQLQVVAMKNAGGMESEIKPFLEKLRKEKAERDKQDEQDDDQPDEDK